MEFQRLLLFAALSFTLLMLWEAWQNDYVRPNQQVSENGVISTPLSISPEGELPQINIDDRPDLPKQFRSAKEPAIQKLESEGRVIVETDLYRIEIDKKGADLRRVDLIKYPVTMDDPDNAFRLMDDADEIFIAQSGLLSLADAGGNKLDVPTHHHSFKTDSSFYQLTPDRDDLNVVLQWQDQNGLSVDKIYTFHRGSYSIDVTYRIVNQSGASWQGHIYQQLQREQPIDSGQAFIYTYTGGVFYSDEDKYKKLSFDDIGKGSFSQTSSSSWIAMIQHYFLGAWIPTAGESVSYYTKSPGNGRYIIGGYGEQKEVASGEISEFSSQYFIGPKLQSKLEAVAPGLELTVDYGILTFIASPLYWLLDKIHGIFGNWGTAIILLTLLIKLIFYKLSETSYRSMAHMRKLQPKLKSLKERYGDDRQGMNQAMMKMYKEEKINPLGGCLPILVQIPVFIALYWMLLESVEMRQAPFILWIQDLSTADPYFVLPLLMGITMLIQQKLNPTPLDPVQAKVMMALPIVFTVFFAFFPAGLVLYWVVNNTLSIAQQWYITRVVMKEK